jgi:diguanylate cyclase (GGDEF)-like protein
MLFGFFNISKQSNQLKLEITGTKVQGILYDISSDLNSSKILLQTKSWRDLPNINNRIDKNISEVQAILKSPANKELFKQLSIKDETDLILNDSQGIQRAIKNNASDAEILDKYQKITHDINVILLMSIHTSKVVLDSEFDSYYLMDVSTKRLPELSQSISAVIGMGNKIISNKDFTQANISLLRKYSYRLADDLRQFYITIETIHNNIPNQSIINTLEIDNLDKSLHEFSNYSQELTLGNKNSVENKFLISGNNSLKLVNSIFHSSNSQLEHKLSERLNSNTIYLTVSVVSTILSILVIIYFALSFYKLQLYTSRRLEYLAITDTLTKIHNRRSLDHIFKKELAYSIKHRNGMGFAIMDVDFFKPYNDTYGHIEGDTALKSVAKALKDTLKRGTDFYFRFGGEEFCFFFKANSIEEVTVVSELMRSAIEKLQIPHSASQVSDVLTASIGVTYSDNMNNIKLDSMIKQADDLLCKSKKNGRNQVTIEMYDRSQTSHV